MNFTTILLVFLLLTLPGCATPPTGLRSNEKNINEYLAKIDPIPTGKARIVVYVYRGERTEWMHRHGVVDVDLDGKRVASKIGNTRYSSFLAESGEVAMTVGQDGDVARCTKKLTLPQNEISFIKISIRTLGAENLKILSIMKAISESVSAEKSSGCGGTWTFEPIASEIALEEIAKIGQK